MLLKNILVQVDDQPSYPSRSAVAVDLARRFEARLIGAYVLPSPYAAALADTRTAAVSFATQVERLQSASARAEETFMDLVHAHGVAGEWLTAIGHPRDDLIRWVHTADLAVLGQANPDDPDSAVVAPEDVILACGRPCLLVPYFGRYEHVGERLLIAWNGSREASRALQDSTALVAGPATASVLAVNPDQEVSTEIAVLIPYLARHGIDATSELITTSDVDPPDMVLSRAADFSADMLVMGCYGHSRLREAVLGGMTRDILRRMTVPVLTAH